MYAAPPTFSYGGSFPSYPTTFGTSYGYPFGAPTYSYPATSFFGGLTTFPATFPAATPVEVKPVKLTYFGVKAKGLLPMLVAEVGGIPYEWEKVDMADWPAMKDSTPFGQLPVMDDGDVHIAQSNAIALYLAKKANLLGSEDADFATSAMLLCQYEDMFNAFIKGYYGPNKEADVDAYLANGLPASLQKLEGLLSGSFTNERTVGELAIFSLLNIMKDMDAACLDAFPAVTAFYDHLLKDAKIAKFFADEKEGALWYKKDW